MYAITSQRASEPGWRAQALLTALLRQRGYGLLWVPVFLSFGIGLYFSLSLEPGWRAYVALAGATLAVLFASRFIGEAFAPLGYALACVAIGLGLAAVRSHAVGHTVLPFRYYGPVEGRIVGIDRSVSDKVRLTLDQVWLSDIAPAKTPERVRVSLHGTQGFVDPQPGLRVMLTAHLGPPGGPVEPGGFDFQRHAWFQQIGAVGYTRTPALKLAEAAPGFSVFRLRMAISSSVQEQLPGAEGALAAAVLTGDRSGIPRDVIEALRKSNLAHLLAISGLHMGLLTGLVFTIIRIAIALVPPVALRVSGKKIAAFFALLAGAGYLAISGGAVSTERAFVMVTVMLGAVLIGQRAISLRAVALAAIIVLILTPEALMGPGFQMSFAATTALVAVFGAMRGQRRWLPKWAGAFVALVLSSAIAGAATAPYAAAHFNRFADYGLIANLLSVPLMGSVVMPGAILAAVGAPFGLDWIGLEIMRLGLRWIVGVAHIVSGWEGSVTYVVAPQGAVLPLITVGALFGILWQGLLRWSGVVPVLLAFVLWTQTERPTVLVSASGGLVSVIGPEGRALSKAKGDGFAALSWLENDGDGADQARAAARPGLGSKAGARELTLPGIRLIHLSGRGGTERVEQACAEADIVVIAKVVETPAGACTLLDGAYLRRNGAVAIRVNNKRPDIKTARQISGARLWNTW